MECPSQAAVKRESSQCNGSEGARERRRDWPPAFHPTFAPGVPASSLLMRMTNRRNQVALPGDQTPASDGHSVIGSGTLTGDEEAKIALSVFQSSPCFAFDGPARDQHRAIGAIKIPRVRSPMM